MADWTFTVTIPDNIKNDLTEAFADAYNYKQNHDGITKKQFALLITKQYIREIYKGYKVKVFNQEIKAIVDDADEITDGIVVS